MKPLLPLDVKGQQSVRRAMTGAALRLLLAELARRPAAVLPILRRFRRMYRAAHLVADGSKVMHLGEKDGGRCTKLSVYVPHFPGKAFEGRVRRALRSDTVWHEQVTLSITDSCPYHCRHCSNSRGARPPLPLPRLLQVVHEIQDIGGSWLNIGGGEPGVVFDRALAVVAEAGDRSETWLNTTGFGLDLDKVRRLRDAGLFGGRVSLHSHRPEEHDAFVGYPGAFKIAADAIRTFREADLFTVLSAALPEERITREMVVEMMRLGRDLGAGFVEIIPVRPVGRAVIACTHAELQHRDINRDQFRSLNTDPALADCPGVNSPAYLETPDRFGCVAGAERLYISASGDVQPCPLVSLAVGNVLDESLAAICGRMRELVKGPRAEQLCYELGPQVAAHVAQGGPDCAALPIPPDKTAEILGSLPPPATPKAWRL